MTAIPLGRASLHGSVPPTRQLRGATSTLAYLVLLRAEIARFTQRGTLVPHWVAASFGLAPDPLRQTASGTGLRRRLTEHPHWEPRTDSSLLL